MPLFVCDKCGCVDNTALGHYWTKDYPDMWDDDIAGLALCSECAPLYFKGGERTRFNGKWHGQFKKTSMGRKRKSNQSLIKSNSR